MLEIKNMSVIFVVEPLLSQAIFPVLELTHLYRIFVNIIFAGKRVMIHLSQNKLILTEIEKHQLDVCSKTFCYRVSNDKVISVCQNKIIL